MSFVFYKENVNFASVRLKADSFKDSFYDPFTANVLLTDLLEDVQKLNRFP